MLTDEARYRILKKLEAQPDISQRQLAQELGISLGKVNFCLQALIEKGLIKARNFSRSAHKKRYLYVLTPAGIENKAAITVGFLKRKMSEYEQLRQEIEEMQREVAANGQAATSEPPIKTTKRSARE